MSRKYSKRTKSTSRKTYNEYLTERAKLEAKGYNLHDVMSETAYNNYYDRMIAAKKAGEIQSQPFQELMKRERFVKSQKQANYLAKAMNTMNQEEGIATIVKAKDIKKLSDSQISNLITYINANKTSGLFGGDYE